jgi:2Fe-2S ferredoxin
VKIQVKDRDGVSHIIEGGHNQTLMELLRDMNFVLGSCNGNAICGTCHVFVDPISLAKLPVRESDERAQLEQAGSFNEGSSRLSCQIRCSDELSGMQVTLAPYD